MKKTAIGVAPKNAIDIVKKILEENSNIVCLDFGIYRPELKHFNERRKRNERRSPFEATEHSKSKHYFRLPRRDILNGAIEKRIVKLFPGEALQVLSKVYVEDAVHIPMLDLEIPARKDNLQFAIESIKALGQKRGALVVSGASYHYYGLELLYLGEWQMFMYKSLLLDDVVDRRWVGHRLLDGFSNLRLSEKGNYGFLPYVVEML